jgi:repressor LexA
MARPETGIRQRILEFVRERLFAGVPPTVREVQAAFKFRSLASAREHLEKLVEAGELLRTPGLARGLRLPDRPQDARVAAVPLLGRVRAGAFTYAAEDVEEHVWTSQRYPAKELFALRVNGESMTGAGLLPGDIVIVRRQPDAEDGQVIVALVEDEATVKTLRRRDGRVELHPANPAFPVLRPDPERLAILGRVVESRREYGD